MTGDVAERDPELKNLPEVVPHDRQALIATGNGDNVARLLPSSVRTCREMASAKQEKEASDKTNEIPRPPEGWTRCHAYVDRKRRFCRQTVVDPDKHVSGPRYCGNHRHLYGIPYERKRIPCPLDGSHSIYEDTVEKHILVCPRAKRRRREEQQPYYRHNVNGGVGCHTTEEGNEKKEKSVEWAKALALRIMKGYQRVFGCSKSEACQSLTFEQMQEAIPLRDLSKPELDAGLEESVEYYRIRSGGYRHLVQQASLIGHLRRMGGLPELGNTGAVSPVKRRKTCLLELGAGRGMLGLVAASSAAASQRAPNMHLVLVERAGTRGKADTVLRNAKEPSPEKSSNYLLLKRLQWTRVQCDLAHVYLPTVLAGLNNNEGSIDGDLSAHRLVVVAKHLCGAGTDLALRSLRAVAPQVDVCVMATCCHGICNWDDYVGRDHLGRALESSNDDESSFGRDEFEMMRRWTSGTVATACAVDDRIGKQNSMGSEGEEEPDVDHSLGAYQPENAKDPFSASSIVRALGLACGVQGLGRACQRLIDHGRCEYMRHVLFSEQSSTGTQRSPTVELCHYTPMDVTPQNAALVARRG